MGISFGISVSILQKNKINGLIGDFDCFRYFELTEDGIPKQFPSLNERNVKTKPDDFKKIPGSPIAYWLKDTKIFTDNASMGDLFTIKSGIMTGNDSKFLRLWNEVSIKKIGFNLKKSREMSHHWYPLSKGGEFRRWYGNVEHIIDLYNNAENILNGGGNFRLRDKDLYFKPYITWSRISSGSISFRYMPGGVLFADAAPGIFLKNDNKIICFLNSKVSGYLLKILNPTLNYQTQDIEKLPISNDCEMSAKKLCEISKLDWDSYETSWDFTQNPIIRTGQLNLEQAFNTWQQQNADAVAEMKRLEEENNKLFIDAYGLQDELTPEVPDKQITLTRADREKDSQRLVSYALGCMMGRYSLDEPGLIYAHAGNQDFEASRYQKFPADADGIIPLTEMHWFEDDATHRIREFLTAVWGKDMLDTNMQWLAESLDKKANETAEDTIRRYLASKFYKDHMQTYKKRPIYWLFSSGKQGAFQALVYLHRYNESTLARMRTEYVMPLISKMSAMANSLESEIENSDSAAEIKRKEKELQNLHKQQAELSTFEEKLRHYADQRITLDLDDGVKVNYGKFGDLLVEVKAITGEK